MEFGIFSQMHVPPWEDEHSRFLRELEVSEAVDAAGFKYDWSPEHHFLTDYSHQPAPEVYLSFVAARTKRLHVGTAITNITAAVNHPARVAERIATLDHLSCGRVEFGTGRGSSSAEWGGFAIPSASETKPMWRESLEQIPRMWEDEPYEFEGKYFRMPKRNVLPKPYTKPHPPLWVACSSPPTFIEAGELGLGSLCFTFGTPSEIAVHVKAYKEAIKRCKNPVGGYINDNIAVTTNMLCLEDGDEARRLYSKARVEFFTQRFFSWLDSIPRPPQMPKEGPIPTLPPPTPEALAEGLRVGGRQIGAPEEIIEVIQMYEDIGVDQLIYAPLTLTLDQKYVLRSIETFGKHVLPKFDKDPVHRTRRQREAAVAARAA
jgi:alkanesulfonate monooxygenase SsuD/methylene tetrahydromethanopterin reductase-like flavin-dependent oxidoreductase (luciferase family)